MQPISIGSCVLPAESLTNVSYRCIAKWIQEFNENRELNEDALHPSRPVTEATPGNIESVR